MNKKVKIAKELLRIAKSLIIADQDSVPDHDRVYIKKVYEQNSEIFLNAFVRFLNLRSNIINAIILRMDGSIEANNKLKEIYNNIEQIIEKHGNESNQVYQQIITKKKTIESLVEDYQQQVMKRSTQKFLSLSTGYEDDAPKSFHDQIQYMQEFNSKIGEMLKVTEDTFYVTQNVNGQYHHF